MQDKLRRRTVLRNAALASAGIGALAGCSGTDDPDTASGDNEGGSNGGESGSDETEDDGSDDTPDVTILEHELVEDDFAPAVEGKVENTSDEEQSYIAVEAKFYNADDERIGEGLDNATDVGAGVVVNFSCTFLGDGEIDNYELEASTSPF